MKNSNNNPITNGWSNDDNARNDIGNKNNNANNMMLKVKICKEYLRNNSKNSKNSDRYNQNNAKKN